MNTISQSDIPSKSDFMKTHSFNFILNEKIFSGLEQEKNKKFTDHCDQGQQNAAISTNATGHGNLLEDNVEQEDISRTFVATNEKSETSVITESKTDYTGSAPKRYTTKCYIEPKTVPIWYTESILLHINSTRRKYEEKIYFKNKLLPFRWSERMYTEVKTCPKRIISEKHIPVDRYIELSVSKPPETLLH